MINLNHLAVKLAMGMDITASVAEQEVERLFRAFLPGTPFEGKMFGVMSVMSISSRLPRTKR